MAYYEVTNGQTSHDTVLNNNDSMYIYDGKAEDTTVNSGGEFNIYESGIYEILPGFAAGAIAAFVAAKLAGTPSEAVMKLYDDAVAYDD